MTQVSVCRRQLIVTDAAGRAAVTVVVAAMLAGRKVQRNLKAKWIAAIFAVSMVTFGLIWVLLSALNRHEAEPRTPPDYPAPSATP